MGDHMTEILGDLLYTEPPNDEASVMPSPEFLKGKVLVKAKRLPPGKGPDDEIEEDNYTQCDGVNFKIWSGAEKVYETFLLEKMFFYKNSG